MIVRAATSLDLDWILEQTKIFTEFYGSERLLRVDDSYKREGLLKIIENHLFLIAESGTERMGFIAGLFSPHIFNPNIRTLCEILWWVAAPYRKTRAGYKLLKEYIRIGKEKADWITMCSIVTSPINEDALERRGFRLMERSYLMEV